MSRKESPSQTAGPYVHIGCTPNFAGVSGVYPDDLGAVMVTDQTKGQRITLTGIVRDGDGTPLTDAMIEIWQADADGRYSSDMTGWGRVACDQTTGAWTFHTIRPGAVPGPDGAMQAPHITFWIVARGINLGLHTRMYFPEDDLSADPVLALTPPDRIPTLIAASEGAGTYRFDICLQGAGETIFFDS